MSNDVYNCLKESFYYADVIHKGPEHLKEVFSDSVEYINPGLSIGASAYVLDNGSAAVVCFAGSDDWFDWLVNLSATELHGVHSGFSRTMRFISPTIIDRVKKLGRDNLHVVGYSQGAGLGQLFAALYGTALAKRTQCTTFAGPRIAKASFWKGVGNSISMTRVSHHGDPVPHLLPARLGWRGYGHEIVLGRKLTLVELYKMYRDARRGLRGKVRVSELLHHHRRSYRSGIEALNKYGHRP